MRGTTSKGGGAGRIVPALAAAGLLLALALPGAARAAQTGRVAGQVTESAKGQAVGGGIVVALQEGKVVAVSAVGQNGGYALEGLPAGEYEVMLLSPGYQVETREQVRVEADGETRVDFALKAG